MLASGPPQPMVAPAGADWSFELKWDGVRALALVAADGSIALRSRNRVDLSQRYPAIVAHQVGAALAPVLAPSVVDGECVVLDPAGRPDFDGVRRGGAAVRFVAFDVLAWRGEDIRDRPLSRRRALLEGVDLPQVTGGAWMGSTVFDDGDALLTATAEQGLEGVMAKRRHSPYRCGVRSPDWVKLPHRTTTPVVVVGWTRARSGGGVAALVVADAGGRMLGAVGSGISDRVSEALAEVLAGIERPGPDPALSVGPVAAELERRAGERLSWVQPLVVVEVRHLGHTAAGLLRQPSLARVRPDLAPTDLAPTDPAPTDPGSTDPAPTDPGGRGR